MKSPIVAALAAVLVCFTATAPPAAAAERRSATMLLNSLPVSQETPGGYRREAFSDWIDADRDGCDTRQEVLLAERVAGRIVGCEVVGGRWRSAYDGASTRVPGSFDIDHRVPLMEAWSSGAWRWTSRTRDAYANDLRYGASLIAVSASSNRSKADREPDEWMPSASSQRCEYVRLWIGVKYRWRLAVDAQEKSYLFRQLATCATSMVVPPRAYVRTNPNAVRPRR